MRHVVIDMCTILKSAISRILPHAALVVDPHVDALVDRLAALPAAIATPIPAAWNANEDLLDLLARAAPEANNPPIMNGVPLVMPNRWLGERGNYR